MEDKEETTFDLDAAMKDGMEKFEDELEAASDETITPPDKAEIDPLETADDSEEVPEPEVEEKPEEDAKTEERKALRFKSHEEAEKGYRNIQSMKTKVEQENRDLQARIAAIEDARQKAIADQEFDTKYLDYSETRHKAALDAIDELDPDDEAYQKKVARAWAEKDRDIRRFEREAAVVPTQQPEQAPDTSGALEFVKEQAVSSDIDPDDLFFKQTCERTPTVDEAGNQMSFGDQVAWAISQTKEYHAEQHKRFQERQKAEADKKNKAFTKREEPLGRGGTVKPSPAVANSVSLNDALEAAMDSRRL